MHGWHSLWFGAAGERRQRAFYQVIVAQFVVDCIAFEDHFNLIMAIRVPAEATKFQRTQEGS